MQLTWKVLFLLSFDDKLSFIKSFAFRTKAFVDKLSNSNEALQKLSKLFKEINSILSNLIHWNDYTLWLVNFPHVMLNNTSYF